MALVARCKLQLTVNTLKAAIKLVRIQTHICIAMCPVALAPPTVNTLKAVKLYASTSNKGTQRGARDKRDGPSTQEI